MISLAGKKFVVIHHSLTKDTDTVSWGAIRRYHVETEKWKDIGYHFGVEIVNGQVEIMVGRLMHKTAAAVKELGMNKLGIHICVVGNFDLGLPTKAVWDAAVKLTAWCLEMIDAPTSNVKRHFDYAPYKTCPGTQFDIVRFRREVDIKRKEVIEL